VLLLLFLKSTEKGRYVKTPMSEKPMGIIMYTPDGYMSAQRLGFAEM
jgi:hypothetical protein